MLVFELEDMGEVKMIFEFNKRMLDTIVKINRTKVSKTLGI